MLKIKRKQALFLIVSVLVVAIIGTSVASEIDSEQTEEDLKFNRLSDEFNLLDYEYLTDVCEAATCNIP